MYRPPTTTIAAADAMRSLFGRTKRTTADECRSRRRRRSHPRIGAVAGAYYSSSSSSLPPGIAGRGAAAGGGSRGVEDDDYDGVGGLSSRRFLSSSSSSSAAAAAAEAAARGQRHPPPHSKPRSVELWEELAGGELSRSGATVDSLRADRVTPVREGWGGGEGDAGSSLALPAEGDFRRRGRFSNPLRICPRSRYFAMLDVTGGDRHPARLLRSERSPSENAS
jgi:hypothetical protein